jgi:hypothetical protein
VKILRLLYTPLALIAGIVSARLGRSIFKSLWARVDSGEPPAPTAPDAGIGKVVGAAALEAATMAATRAAVERASAASFHHLVGVWPKDRPDPATVTETSRGRD